MLILLEHKEHLNKLSKTINFQYLTPIMKNQLFTVRQTTNVRRTSMKKKWFKQLKKVKTCFIKNNKKRVLYQLYTYIYT